MNYFDSSALLKLLFEEAESAELERWVSRQPPLSAVSSELVAVEVVRAARRLDPQVVPAARRLVAQLDRIPMTSDLIAPAADVGTGVLRSLDAIHLATALSLGPALDSLVVYDGRLAGAATDLGLSVVHPGMV